MKSKKSLLANLPEKYKDQLKRFSTKSLQILQSDRNAALESARKGITQIEPNNFKKDYIEKVADGIQVLARIVLEERGRLTKD